MAASSLRRFSNPEKLKEIRPDCLARLLYPYREFFQARGVAIPRPGEGYPTFDHAALLKTFLAPDQAIPTELIEALYVINEMASPSGMDAVLVAARQQGVRLDALQTATPLDVAVQAYVHDRNFLEMIHYRRALFKSHEYTYFAASGPMRLESVAEEQLEALRCDLDDYYSALNRGRHCRIDVFQQDGRTWFIVRHGNAFRRVVDISREPNVVLTFRPESFTTMVLVPETGELGIHASSKRDLCLYCKLMGRHLFQSDGFFTGLGKYTLAPLVVKGVESLRCGDVAGIDWVKLVEVRYDRDAPIPAQETRSAADLYDAFSHQIVPPDAVLTAARFRIKFRGAANGRHLRIMPPNKASHSRESDVAATEQWLHAREFLRRQTMPLEGRSCTN